MKLFVIAVLLNEYKKVSRAPLVGSREEGGIEGKDGRAWGVRGRGGGDGGKREEDGSGGDRNPRILLSGGVSLRPQT